MLKLLFLMSAAIVTGATIFSVPQASAKVSACDVDSRSEVIVWAQQHPGVSYLGACQNLRRR